MRHALVDILRHGDIADSAIDNAVISVSEVRMSPDLKIATVFVSALAGDDDAVTRALTRNARYIRGRLSGALRHMKFMPEFRFRTDTSFDNFDKIDRLLRSPEVARDLDHSGGENDEKGNG